MLTTPFKLFMLQMKWKLIHLPFALSIPLYSIHYTYTYSVYLSELVKRSSTFGHQVNKK